MNIIPSKCINCGERDFDVQQIVWLAVSDGEIAYHLTDTAIEGFRDACAHCPSCGLDWELDWED